MQDHELRRLYDQGPKPECPPLSIVVRRAREIRRRARRKRSAVVASVGVAILALVAVEPWSRHGHAGVAGADVLAAVNSGAGCGGTSRRATATEADPVRFLPTYVPADFTIDDAFSNHDTDAACFRFYPRTVFVRQTGPNLVAATLTISTGSESTDQIECGPAPVTPVDAPKSDYQRCVQVRGHTGAIVHILDTTWVAWIEPGIGAVDVRTTELAPEALLGFVQRLTTRSDGTIIVARGVTPAGYTLAYQNWKAQDELTVRSDFNASFVQRSLPSSDPPILSIAVWPTRRSLWEMLPGSGGFEIVNIHGDEGIMYRDGDGITVSWKLGDNLFSVRAPQGMTPKETLRVARSFAPATRNDARLIDPSNHG
jgi:hypothetical protein